MQLTELDGRVTLRDQMSVNSGPVVLVNTFSVAPEEIEQLLEAWAADAAFMKAQPGFISTQLHRGVGPSSLFLNYAVWESAAAFAGAFGHPAFRASLAKYPPSTVATPHLFHRVAVPGICVA
jgi:heme-degrading monooxygenase HmoA